LLQLGNKIAQISVFHLFLHFLGFKLYGSKFQAKCLISLKNAAMQRKIQDSKVILINFYSIDLI